MSFSEQIKQEILNMGGMKHCCKNSIHYGELYSETSEITKNEVKAVIGARTCCKRAFLKGVFLGSGYIVSPEAKYHFEVSLNTKLQANYIIELLKEFGINAKCIKRNKYVVYIKDGESISNVLRVFGATNSLIEFENVRIEKSIKNEINRNINCETANLNKIVTSSYRQIQAIEILKKTEKYVNLNDEQKELCDLRVSNPDISLEELAKKCSYKITKSGVYHRLNKIVKMAGDLCD